MTQNAQIPMNLAHAPSFERVDFIVSPSNQLAVNFIDSWPNWPLHAAALVGPKGCGKSHLAHCWLERAGGTVFTPGKDVSDVAASTALLIEDLPAEDDIFHLYNWTRETGGFLLFTSETAPNKWSVALPDLRSRLSTLPVLDINEPDDMLLSALLMKLFSDRQLQVDYPVVDYILPRMERSFAAASGLVMKLDEAALSGKRKITRALARDILNKGLLSKDI